MTDRINGTTDGPHTNKMAMFANGVREIRLRCDYIGGVVARLERFTTMDEYDLKLSEQSLREAADKIKRIREQAEKQELLAGVE